MSIAATAAFSTPVSRVTTATTTARATNAPPTVTGTTHRGRVRRRRRRGHAFAHERVRVHPSRQTLERQRSEVGELVVAARPDDVGESTRCAQVSTLARMSEAVGTVEVLSRFPVKSMQGEKLATAEVTERGVVGDRAYALVETETGKVLSGKHPRIGTQLLACRAEYAEPPASGGAAPAVRITLPDGTAVMSDTPGAGATLVRISRTRGHAAAGGARGLHDRFVPPRHRGLRSRRASRHGDRVAARRRVLRRRGDPFAGPSRCVLRPVPGLRADDLDPRAPAEPAAREPLRRAAVPHERGRRHDRRRVRRERMARAVVADRRRRCGSRSSSPTRAAS